MDAVGESSEEVEEVVATALVIRDRHYDEFGAIERVSPVDQEVKHPSVSERLDKQSAEAYVAGNRS